MIKFKHGQIQTMSMTAFASILMHSRTEIPLIASCA
jgi:hypothetical protein